MSKALTPPPALCAQGSESAAGPCALAGAALLTTLTNALMTALLPEVAATWPQPLERALPVLSAGAGDPVIVATRYLLSLERLHQFTPRPGSGRHGPPRSRLTYRPTGEMPTSEHRIPIVT